MSKLVLLHRIKTKGRHSIEGVFSPLDELRTVKRQELPCDLNSVWNFLRLVVFGIGIKEKHIHIVGDVHYMAQILFWKKSIVTVHDCNHYEDLSGLRKWLMGIIWYSLPLRIAKRVVVISPYVKSQILGHFNIAPDKIEVIPNSFHPMVLKEKLKDKRYFTILIVGTRKNKNLKRLIESVKGMNDVKLDIIGDLSDAELILLGQLKIKYSNAFHISWSVLCDHYNSADVLFFASTKEGFGLPILEAQSCGLPVITSNTTSMPFVAGKGACIVNPFEVEDIKKAILKIKNELHYKETIVSQGYINIERFTVDSFVQSYLQIYNREFNLNIP